MSFIFVRHNRRFQRIPCPDIRYIEANQNYVRIYTSDQCYLVLSTLRQVQDKLPHTEFCRIHRSFIVAVAQIEAFDNHYVYLADKRLPMGPAWLPRLLSELPIVAPEPVRIVAVKNDFF